MIPKNRFPEERNAYVQKGATMSQLQNKRIIAGIIILLLTVNIVLLSSLLARPETIFSSRTAGESGPRAVPTQELVDIIVSVQNIRRGSLIAPDAVRFMPWPLHTVPFNIVTGLSDVVGKRARTDIYVEQPILTSYVVDDLSSLASIGSDVAAMTPYGHVAITLRVAPDYLTHGLRPGDSVDVVHVLSMSNPWQASGSHEPNRNTLNSTDQAIGSADGPNRAHATPCIYPICLPVSDDPSAPISGWVAQRTVLAAYILWIGPMPADGNLTRPFDAETAYQGQPTIPVTLAVTPQEAVIMIWAREQRIPAYLLLRSAADSSRSATASVTLDYMMEEHVLPAPDTDP